ncbi:hypothetical protein KCU73_g8330, partial [Aureobasidium melanogenum]
MTSSLLGQSLPAPSSEQPSDSSDVDSSGAASKEIVTTATAQSTGTPSSAPSITNTAAVTQSSERLTAYVWQSGRDVRFSAGLWPYVLNSWL